MKKLSNEIGRLFIAVLLMVLMTMMLYMFCNILPEEMDIYWKIAEVAMIVFLCIIDFFAIRWVFTIVYASIKEQHLTTQYSTIRQYKSRRY